MKNKNLKPFSTSWLICWFKICFSFRQFVSASLNCQGKFCGRWPVKAQVLYIINTILFLFYKHLYGDYITLIMDIITPIIVIVNNVGGIL